MRKLLKSNFSIKNPTLVFLFFILLDLLLIIIPLFIALKSPLYWIDLRFSIADFIQVLVVEAALCPFLINEYIKEREKPVINVVYEKGTTPWKKIAHEISPADIILLENQKVDTTNLGSSYLQNFYFLTIRNSGKSMLEKCEVVLNRIYDEHWHFLSNFEHISDINFLWPGTKNIYKNINPKRMVNINIVQTFNPKLEQSLSHLLPDIDSNSKICEGLYFSASHNPITPPCFLGAGTYYLEFSIFASNCEPKHFFLQVTVDSFFDKSISVKNIDLLFHFRPVTNPKITKRDSDFYVIT